MLKLRVLLGIVQCSEVVQCSEDVQCSEVVQCSEDVQCSEVVQCSEDVYCSEGVQIQRFPMVGVCPKVSESVQRILNVKQIFLF